MPWESCRPGLAAGRESALERGRPRRGARPGAAQGAQAKPTGGCGRGREGQRLEVRAPRQAQACRKLRGASTQAQGLGQRHHQHLLNQGSRSTRRAEWPLSVSLFPHSALPQNSEPHKPTPLSSSFSPEGRVTVNRSLPLTSPVILAGPAPSPGAAVVWLSRQPPGSALKSSPAPPSAFALSSRCGVPKPEPSPA